MTHTSGIVEVASASIADGHKFVINEFFIRRVEDDVAIASDICDPVTGLPSEANAKRIAALWNMAERLGLTTEEIEGIASDTNSEATVECFLGCPKSNDLMKKYMRKHYRRTS